jgi:hypothetical protein
MLEVLFQHLEACTTGVFIHWNHSSIHGKYQGKLLCLVLAMIFHCGHVLYQNGVCLAGSVPLCSANMAY